MAPPVTASLEPPAVLPPAAPAPHDGASVADGMAAIGRLIDRGRRRLRAQGALEGATTASIVASAGALAAVWAVRTERIEAGAGVALLAASAGVIGVGAVLGALRRLDDEQVARRIDRASGLADRLSTAVAFAPQLADPAAAKAAPVPPELAAALAAVTDDDDTRALMLAAVRDAARAAPRADVVRATPLHPPRDLRVALGFAVVAALAAGLGIAVPPREPVVLGATPAIGRHGLAITLDGERLCGPRAPAERACELPGAMVTFGDGAGGSAAITASIDGWTGGAIHVVVPAAAPIGPTTIVVWARGKKIGAVPFDVLSDRDDRNFSADTVALDDDDEAYLRDLVAELKAVAKRDDAKPLDEYAAKIEQLLDQADRGELTKEQLLAEMKKAEDALAAQAEPQQADVDKALAESGQELAKNPLTKELGQALQQGDLAKAKAELEKLAEKLADGEITPKQQDQLAKTLEETAKQFEQKQQKDQQQQEAQQAKAEDEIKRLEKEKDDAKTEEERKDAERRLDKKKQELEQLRKDQDKKEQSAQRRSLDRLHKDMDKAAKDLQKKPEPGQDPSQDGHQQASRNLKDAADETGKVDSDKRKQAAQKKVASQMDDLREAMRRAKQRGQRGPKNPFNQQGQQQQGKQQDFQKRAQGGQGQKGAWKPGAGQGQAGQGKGQPGAGQQGQDGQEPGGQGQEPGGKEYGDGHDPNLVGDPTGKSGITKDESVSGVHGKGPSRRETILAAAQKGFASTAYRQVFTDYKDIVEQVMKSEKVPPSYKYYVKKYFTKIKPHAMD